MKFNIDNEQISFKEFSEKFPEEASILTEHQDLEANFMITDCKLALAYGEFNPIFIDIINTLKKHEVFFFKNSLYKDPLARAIGLKKGKPKPVILDATAGMMGDSLLIYAYGVEKLICCERNPLAGTLIQNSVKNSGLDIEFYFGSALDMDSRKNIEIIYFDPMYQEKNIKTAPKKEMAIFRNIVGVDEDALENAKKLRELALERLVIKRPNKAKPLIENPSHTIKGKSTSYDVYLKF